MALTGTLLGGAMRARRVPSHIQCFRYPLRATTAAVAKSQLCQTPFVDSQRCRMNSTAAAVEAPTEIASPFPFPHRQELDKQQNARQILLGAAAATRPRNDWTEKEVSAMYHQPLLELAHQAVSIICVLDTIISFRWPILECEC